MPLLDFSSETVALDGGGTREIADRGWFYSLEIASTE